MTNVTHGLIMSEPHAAEFESGSGGVQLASWLSYSYRIRRRISHLPNN